MSFNTIAFWKYFNICYNYENNRKAGIFYTNPIKKVFLRRLFGSFMFAGLYGFIAVGTFDFFSVK